MDMTTPSTLSLPLPVRARVPFRGGVLLATTFVVLSLLDLGLTWYLLEMQGECFYEANPIAAGVLANWGWWGLAGYKLTCASTVLTAGLIVSRRRPRVARRLLALACPVVAVVVAYSLVLLTRNLP